MDIPPAMCPASAQQLVGPPSVDLTFLVPATGSDPNGSLLIEGTGTWARSVLAPARSSFHLPLNMAVFFLIRNKITIGGHKGDKAQEDREVKV